MPGPFRVQAVELVRVHLPLVRPFATAYGVTSVKDALLVHVFGDDAEGWGECGALPEPGYSGETIDTARLALRDHLVPRALCNEGFAYVAGNAFAKAALEAAILDAQLRVEDRSLASELGGTRDRIVAGVAIGLERDTSALAELARAYTERGYRRIKCKVVPGQDVQAVAAVRSAIGDDIALAVDANGSYSFEQALDLAALDEFNLQCIEQPLAPDALEESALLAAGIATPVCLDESITSAATAALALSVGAGAFVNLKPGRVGGIREARRVHDVCATRATPLLIGGMLETGIGRAVNIALASLPGVNEPGDCSASDRYFAEDLTEPFVLASDGTLGVPAGPGIGVEPRPEMLRRYTVMRETIGRR